MAKSPSGSPTSAGRAPQGARGLKRSRVFVTVSLHKKEVSTGRQRLPFHFLSLLVEARVYVVDVFLVQAVLGEAQAFTETYKMEIINLQMRHSILMESLVA